MIAKLGQKHRDAPEPAIRLTGGDVHLHQRDQRVRFFVAVIRFGEAIDLTLLSGKTRWLHGIVLWLGCGFATDCR